MSNRSAQQDPQPSSEPTPKPENHTGLVEGLSGFGSMMFNIDRNAGRKPRFYEGMTIQDAVFITGLPEAEAARRIRQMKEDPNPDYYAALYLSKGAGEKRNADSMTSTPREPAQIIQLPLWPEPVRGTPNSFLRGALFAAIQGKEREYLKGQFLAARDGIKIRFTGMQLDQSDLDVWEQAAELARSHPLGNVCHFTIHGFLKALDRNTGKSQHDWLKDSLRRLAATCVEITHGRYTYGGSLLEFALDEKEKVYVLRLNPTILNLYSAGWTGIDWETRKKLRRKPLALWLHGYLSSDAENYPTKIETLHRLSGSKTKELWKFKQNLKAALADLATETGDRMGGTITDNEMVEWICQPTPTQARHLIKKAVKTQGSGVRRRQLTHVADVLNGKPKK